jgi:N-acetyl sugar amidotransferase
MQCSRCISDDTFGLITYDNQGICNYCHSHDALESQYPTGMAGKILLESLADEIKSSGHRRPFDAVVGVSGGKDSSYLLYLCSTLDIRPLAVHYDNGWDTPIAARNIKTMTDALGISLINYRVKQAEVDDLIKSFLFSHTQDAEAATDLGLMKCLFKAASSYKIKYILDGHSFRTEGMAPLSWSYMDGRYIKSVHAKYGSVPLNTYPLLTLTDQLWYGLKGIKRPRLLYYIDYRSEAIREFLEKHFFWKWYGGHHLENTYTAFFDYYYRLNKLGYDGRKVELSALIRSKQLTREQALERLSSLLLPLDEESHIIFELKRRLKIPDKVFASMMDPKVKRTHKDFSTYRRHFKALKPLLWAMARTKRIPDSFYLKYCKGEL